MANGLTDWHSIAAPQSWGLGCSALLFGAVLFAGDAAQAQDGEPEEDDALLFDDDLFDAGEVVITGSRREERLAETTVATEVIGAEQIQGSGAETVAELLEEQPGIDVFDDVRGQSVRLGGLDPEHVLILVDGERTVGRINGGLDLSRYTLDEVERIEIVRGASSALYGSDALGGVINIITRRAEDDWELRGRATYGYTDRHRSNLRSNFQGGPRADDDGQTLPRDGYSGTYDLSVTAGRRARNWDARVSVGYHRLDAFDLDPRDAASNGTESTQWTASGRARVRLTSRADLHIRAGYSFRDTGAIDQRGRVLFDRLTRTEDLQVSVAPEVRLRNGLGMVRASIAYSRFSDQFLLRLQENPPPTPSSKTTEDLLSVGLRWAYPINDSHSLNIGYDAFMERLDSQRLQRPGNRGRLAPYIQHEWTVSTEPYFVISLGARVDADSWFGSAVSPKLALRFDPNDDIVIRASVGRGFRAPDFRELLLNFSDNESIGYVVEGNPDLRPESSWSVNGGIEYRPHRRVWLALLGHFNRVDDLITTDTVGMRQSGATLYSYINIDEAQTAGGELRLRYRPIDEFEIDAGYTYLDARNLRDDSRLPGRARHRASLRMVYEHEGSDTRFLWRSQLVGPRAFTARNDAGDLEEVFSESYLSLDLRAEKRFGDHLKLFVGADNVMNNGGVYLGVRPRTYYIGIAAER